MSTSNEAISTELEVRRVVEAARDALTDEMVGRLTEAVGEGLSLLDQINRSGLEKALPSIARMVRDGDLERLVQLARVYGSAEDALSDEMIGRLAETMAEGLSLMDRLSRGGVLRLVEMMERMQASGALERIAVTLPKLMERLEHVEHVLGSLESAVAEAERMPAPPGGIGGLWRIARDAETQRGMQLLQSFNKHLRGARK
ncbi:MAG TPA: hypothetical protein VLX30_12700 [Burkholderiales bacterium]|nr:hypothetical protein [Burkholderiales bacterium]